MQEVGQEKDQTGMQSFHSKYIKKSTRQVANASRKNGTWIGKMESNLMETPGLHEVLQIIIVMRSGSAPYLWPASQVRELSHVLYV